MNGSRPGLHSGQPIRNPPTPFPNQFKRHQARWARREWHLGKLQKDSSRASGSRFAVTVAIYEAFRAECELLQKFANPKRKQWAVEKVELGLQEVNAFTGVTRRTSS